jgi:hypothetical protein
MSVEKFIPVGWAATRLGLPSVWLKTEAESGRIPALRVGNKTLVDLDAVRQSLMNRAAANTNAPAVTQQPLLPDADAGTSRHQPVPAAPGPTADAPAPHPV